MQQIFTGVVFKVSTQKFNTDVQKLYQARIEKHIQPGAADNHKFARAVSSTKLLHPYNALCSV
jgi:hypothetical protein